MNNKLNPKTEKCLTRPTINELFELALSEKKVQKLSLGLYLFKR